MRILSGVNFTPIRERSSTYLRDRGFISHTSKYGYRRASSDFAKGSVESTHFEKGSVESTHKVLYRPVFATPPKVWQILNVFRLSASSPVIASALVSATAPPISPSP